MQKEAPQNEASYFSHSLRKAVFLFSPRQINELYYNGFVWGDELKPRERHAKGIGYPHCNDGNSAGKLSRLES